MDTNSTPREFSFWRTDRFERQEDAAYTFGYHLMKHCRDHAVNSLPAEMRPDDKQKAVEAVHIALHNLMDLLEGFWKLESGSEHSVEYVLQVLVRDKERKEIERVDITSGLDLPIGFWKWALDGEFR